MLSVGAVTGAAVGSAGFVFRVQKLSQLFEVLTKRFEHAALVQGCGWMQQGEEDEVFQVERLAANLGNPHLPLQQGLRRPIS